MNLGQKIKLVRASQGISREEVANALHVSLQAYGKLERGETEISVERLQHIADTLGVSKQYIEAYETTDRFIFAHTANDEHQLINNNIHSQVNQISDKLIDTLREQLAQKDAQIATLQAQIDKLLEMLAV
jgi:transcriptional regulator with XRE-family HTH domain